MKSFLTSVFPTLVLVCTLTSCGGLQEAATGPEPTKFLKSTGVNMSERSARLPFDHSWHSPKTDFSKYKNIVVRPVTTAYLRTENWEGSKSAAVPTKRSYERQSRELARYWNKSLAKAFSSPLCVFYKTTDTSKPGTLILEVALTEVRFAQPTSKTTAKTSGKPTSTTEPLSNLLSGPPMCAFESRVRDAATGKLLSTAADRRRPEIIVISDAKKTPLAKPNQDICDEWSKQLMERSNPEIYPTVKRKWLSFF